MVGQSPGNFEEVEEQKKKLAELRCFTIDRLRHDDAADEEEGEAVEAVEYEEVEEQKKKLAELRCFTIDRLRHDDAADEEEGEEEEGEDPLERVRQQRHETDHRGIRNWLKDNG